MKTERLDYAVLRYMVQVLLILMGLYALYLFSHVAQGQPVPNGAIFTALTNAFVGISIGGAAYLLGRRKVPPSIPPSEPAMMDYNEYLNTPTELMQPGPEGKSE